MHGMVVFLFAVAGRKEDLLDLSHLGSRKCLVDTSTCHAGEDCGASTPGRLFRKKGPNTKQRQDSLGLA